MLKWFSGRNVGLRFSSDFFLLLWQFFEYPNSIKQGETFQFVLGEPPCGAFYQMTPWLRRLLNRGINELASKAAVGSHGRNPDEPPSVLWLVSTSSDTDYIKKIGGHVVHSGFLYSDSRKIASSKNGCWRDLGTVLTFHL